MSPEEAEFVDRLGLFMEMLGGPRTMGRVYGWLLICDPPQQSLTELAQTLSVSKAPSAPSPASFRTAGWSNGCRVRPVNTCTGSPRAGSQACSTPSCPACGSGSTPPNFGLSLLDDDRSEQRERLEDFRDFCEFSAQDYRDELMQRWIDYRGKRRKR